MSPTNDIPSWLGEAIRSLAAGDTDGWMRIYAADAIHEFPLAAEGRPRRLDGREAIATYMRAIADRIRFKTFDNVRVREAGDETIVEATGHHLRLPGDEPFDLAYIWFITRRDGKVTYFRDYMSLLLPPVR